MTEEQYKKLNDDQQATIFEAFMLMFAEGDPSKAIRMLFHASTCKECADNMAQCYSHFVRDKCEVVELPKDTAFADNVRSIVSEALDKTTNRANMN